MTTYYRDYYKTLEAKDIAYKEGREKGLEEGLEKGLEKGREEGLEENALEFIVNMLSDFTDEQIAKVSRRSVEEIVLIREDNV